MEVSYSSPAEQQAAGAVPKINVQLS